MIAYKVKIPKNVDEVHQNVIDIAESAMNKNVMTDLKQLKLTAGAAYDPVQIQTLINKLDEIIGKILKS